jgi:hypothetical protein
MAAETKLHTALTEKLTAKELAPSTIALYLRNLERLAGGPLKSISFLKDIPAIEEKLAQYKPNTRRGYIIGICAILGLDVGSKPKKSLYDRYFTLMTAANAQQKAADSSGVKSETQAANWVDWKDVEAAHQSLGGRVDDFKGLKAISPAQYGTLLSWVVLSLYTCLPPRRNADYTQTQVARNAGADSPKDSNWLDWAGRRFVFNIFKTAKSEGQQLIAIPEPLAEVLAIYLRFHPLLKGKRLDRPFSVPFLVAADGSPLSAGNSITRILNKIFGKRVGSSMLRHSYLSGKYAAVNAEQAADATAMAHSVATQKEYVKQ